MSACADARLVVRRDGLARRCRGGGGRGAGPARRAAAGRPPAVGAARGLRVDDDAAPAAAGCPGVRSPCSEERVGRWRGAPPPPAPSRGGAPWPPLAGAVARRSARPGPAGAAPGRRCAAALADWPSGRAWMSPSPSRRGAVGDAWRRFCGGCLAARPCRWSPWAAACRSARRRRAPRRRPRPTALTSMPAARQPLEDLLRRACRAAWRARGRASWPVSVMKSTKSDGIATGPERALEGRRRRGLRQSSRTPRGSHAPRPGSRALGVRHDPPTHASEAAQRRSRRVRAAADAAADRDVRRGRQRPCGDDVGVLARSSAWWAGRPQ